MFLVFGEWIDFRPAFLFQVGNDVLAGGLAGLFSEKPDRLLDARLVMTHPAVVHVVFGGALKLIQPEMDLLKSLAE